MLAACWRQAWIVALCVVVFAAAAIAYAMSLQPKFTSFATILLDQDRAALVELISEQQVEALREVVQDVNRGRGLKEETFNVRGECPRGGRKL